MVGRCCRIDDYRDCYTDDSSRSTAHHRSCCSPGSNRSIDRHLSCCTANSDRSIVHRCCTRVANLRILGYNYSSHHSCFDSNTDTATIDSCRSCNPTSLDCTIAHLSRSDRSEPVVANYNIPHSTLFGLHLHQEHFGHYRIMVVIKCFELVY